MPLRLITPSTFEPVTLVEAKAQLRVDHNEENDLISSLITAARQAIETYCDSAIVRQSFRYSLDSTARVMQLPYANPLVSVDLVGYYQNDGTLNVLDAGDYGVDTESIPGRVFLNQSLSVEDLREFSGFFVEYTCGPATSYDIPALLKAAVLVLIGHFYENRERLEQDMPLGVKYLLAPFRILGPLPTLQVVE